MRGCCCFVTLALLLSLLRGCGGVSCDVVVLGGSTAALATAITAAEANASTTVCLTEPLWWLGGQMTASGVPAFDFGRYNRDAANQPRSFRELMAFLHADGRADAGCWVSTTCFLPPDLVYGWINPRVAALPNLNVLYRTVVSQVRKSPDGRRITAVTVIQRSPKQGVDETDILLSKALPDMYSPTPSESFDKSVLTLQGAVFVDATEYGDVLVAGGFPVAQGVELPYENSTTTDDQCGQAATLTFYMSYVAQAPPPSPSPPVPSGGEEGEPFTDPAKGERCPGKHSPYCSISTVWTYRRAHLGPGGDPSIEVMNVGDTTQQNWGGGNDLDTMYFFKPLSEARVAAARGEWDGGVNLTTMAALENRSYGWYHAYRQFAGPDVGPRMVLNYTTSGTATGLSMAPYLRDTRRSVGIGGFRQFHDSQAPTPDRPGARIGFPFYDAVALGNYNADDHNVHTCDKPAYMTDYSNVLPFFVPFRALTNKGADNLLVAGKTMAQTFYANAASRLHPCEWTTGVAAGGAAVFMLRNGLNTTGALARVSELQHYLNSSTIGQPLNWSLPAQHSYTCALSRCIYVGDAGKHTTNTCGGDCKPLAANEWLANADYWKVSSSDPSVIVATTDTWLKKSTIQSQYLPASDKRAVKHGDPCHLVTNDQYDGYYLCTVQ